MLIFNLTTLHLWGRVLAKFPEARAIAYADDGYIKACILVYILVYTLPSTLLVIAAVSHHQQSAA